MIAEAILIVLLSNAIEANTTRPTVQTAEMVAGTAVQATTAVAPLNDTRTQTGERVRLRHHRSMRSISLAGCGSAHGSPKDRRVLRTKGAPVRITSGRPP
jgi:hypothetical protein